jgi:simple sugar transport system ATP-binding protein
MTADADGHPGGDRPLAVVPRLELAGIVKQFGATLANDRIDLRVMSGEIHALLGENGAGKSTLVKIVYGILKADAGEVRWDGRPAHIGSPAQARRLGIGMVFQHFSLFDSLTVAENIALGIDERIPVRALSERIAQVSARYGLALDPARHVHTLSVGERQRVEIVRCLLQDPKLLVMDEPTSVLTPQEAERLFETLRRLAGEGCSILYISHKLEEIRALCSTATILRDGRVVERCDPRTESARSLAQMMIGVELVAPTAAVARSTGEIRLEVDGLSLEPEDPFGTALNDIRIAVRAGEIVGIAGVAGNGQAEFLSALSGERLLPNGAMIRFDREAVGHLGPEARRRLGMAFVPEERIGRGAVPDMSLAENGLLTAYAQPTADLVRCGLVRADRTHRLARRIIAEFNVVASGSDAEARSLSGGNLQKFIIGREIVQASKLLVAAHPTWGVDAGATAAIHRALIGLARAGSAVLVVSHDLDELFAISDRLAVMYQGRLSEPRPTREMTTEAAGLLMGGHRGDIAAGITADPHVA